MLRQYVAAFLITSFTHLVLALFVYLKGPRRLTHVTFALYALSIAWWSLFEALAITADEPGTALLLWRVDYVAVIFIPIFFLHFVVSLSEPAERARRQSLIRASYLVGLGFLLANATPWFIPEAVPKFSFKFFANPGVVYPWFFACWMVWAAYGVFVLLPRLYARSEGLRRVRSRYLCASWLVTYLGGAPNFLPVFNLEVPVLMPYGTYAVALNALVTAYAIARYRLMDMTVVATRATVFTVVYALLLGLPLVATLVWQPQVERLLGERWWVWLWVSCAALAVAAYYANLHLQRRADSRLLAEPRHYQQTLRRASQRMTRVRNLSRLLDLVVHVVMKAVGLSHAAVFLETPEQGAFVLRAVRTRLFAPAFERLTSADPLVRLLLDVRQPLVADELSVQVGELSPSRQSGNLQAGALAQMEALGASVVVPSFIQQRLIGFLILGDKLNGKLFTGEDLAVFATLANQAALAIENARFFEEMKTHEAHLIQSEKMASLGQLASGMAHEIRNPLAIISGESQLYLEQFRGKDEQVERLLASILEECDRASDVTRRILRFAAPVKSDYGPVDVPAVVEDSLRLAAFQINLDRIERRVLVAAKLPKVWGNQTQLQEVILNLILNAGQAMGEGGGWLELTAESLGEQVEIRVSDTGPGISREKLVKLFDPFYTTKHNGTGLGLFVSHRIIRAHNGSIAVRSTEGKGTTFAIRLPVWRDIETPLSSSHAIR